MKKLEKVLGEATLDSEYFKVDFIRVRAGDPDSVEFHISMKGNEAMRGDIEEAKNALKTALADMDIALERRLFQ